jgi:hypothetical protein
MPCASPSSKYSKYIDEDGGYPLLALFPDFLLKKQFLNLVSALYKFKGTAPRSYIFAADFRQEIIRR